MRRRVIEEGLDASTAAVFAETESAIEAQLETLRASLTAVDPTLAEALKGGREKILYQLHNLRTRFINNRGKRDETALQQLERLFTLLYPNKGLQERELNFTYFLARYGYEVIDQIYAAVEPATLVLLGDDYDGGHKAWVRWPDGRDDIVPGSQVQRQG